MQGDSGEGKTGTKDLRTATVTRSRRATTGGEIKGLRLFTRSDRSALVTRG